MRMKPLFILILLSSATGARAQHAAPATDTVLKGSTIEVVQSYKPQVRQAPKPEWVPHLPPVDTIHPVFSYDVPQQTLYYTYSSLPLRPLALGNEIPPLPFANYVKVGGGNLSTLFLDAGIGSIKGKDYETAIQIHHISQKGAIVNQQSALSGIEADGMLHKESNDWHASISGERNQYYYYGYNHDLHNYNSDSVKQTYVSVRACVDMKNKGDSTGALGYHPALNVSLYTAKVNTTETSVGFNVPVTYKIDNALQLQAALTGDITHLATNDTATNNNYLEVLPGIGIHSGQFAGHALLGLAAGMGGNQYFLPDILAAYTMPAQKFTISGGWQSTLRQNTYEQLSTENPYLFNNYLVMQTKKSELFANFYGGAGDNLTYSGRLSWWGYNDLPSFLSNVGDQKQFYVVYDNVNAISVQLAARYKVANIWTVGGTADFYHFYNGSQQYVWNEPSMKIKGDFTANPFPKFTVTAYLAMLGGMYAKDINNNVVSLKPIADIGGNAEYQVISRLSVFVQLSNLLNDKYQRWYGYQAYGFNIYGGVRLKF